MSTNIETVNVKKTKKSELRTILDINKVYKPACSLKCVRSILDTIWQKEIILEISNSNSNIG